MVGITFLVSLCFAKPGKCHLFYFILFFPFWWMLSLCSSRWVPSSMFTLCLLNLVGTILFPLSFHFPYSFHYFPLFFLFFLFSLMDAIYALPLCLTPASRCHFTCTSSAPQSATVFSGGASTWLVPHFLCLVTQLLQLPPRRHPLTS